MSKFKVLWIDDQPEKCVRERKVVERIIKGLGFEDDIDIESDISPESLNNFDGTLYKKIHGRDIDLFLIDYNLKNEVLGSDVVQKIRKDNEIYCDIVFYSSVKNTLIDTVKTSFESDSIMDYYDGVYITPLGDEFAEKVHYIINRIIKSWYNVHSIRGIVLSKASKFEHMVNNVIKNNYEHCLYDIKGALRQKGDNVRRNTKLKWESVNNTDDPVPLILDDPINFNWAVKRTILEEIINNGFISLESYEDLVDVFSLRNDFAHNPIHLESGRLVLNKKNRALYFSEEEIEKIRKQLTRIENELEGLCENYSETAIAEVAATRINI